MIDDFADDPSFAHQSKLLHTPYTRGHRNMISEITTTQQFNVTHPIIRVNSTEPYVYRLRNYKDTDTVVEEVIAAYNKRTLLQLYNAATEEPFSFLDVGLASKDREGMFCKRSDHKLVSTREGADQTNSLDKYSN